MHDNERDAAWVLAIEQRDETALEAVVRCYTGYVLTVVRKIAVPPLTEEDAEEVASAVFATLWKKVHELRNPFALKGYLAQIARRAAMDRLRRYKELLPLEEDVLIVSGKQPDNAAVLREQVHIISATLRTMDPTRRACMVYRYYYGEELAVIAKRLNLSLSTVKSHVYRGRKILVEALKERGYCYEENNNISDFI